MVFKDKLPVSYLLFTAKGRINRLTYWTVCIFIWTSFYVLFNSLQYLINYQATIVLYPVLFWALIATKIKRLHDSNRSGYWLFLVCIPVLGVLILIYLLGFKKGSRLSNRYGTNPDSAPDYYKNNTVPADKNSGKKNLIVNDVTQLNPIEVAAVLVPETIDQLQQIVKTTGKPLSIGGGRFSMGGQTASPETLHLDMRKLNRAIQFSPEKKVIEVEAGIRWCDIQKLVDAVGLSIKIMQTYANFTVGGSLSVNCHGRYIGLGPLILSVRSIHVLFANGDIVKASPEIRPEIFYACIGCYNAIGIIVQAELELEENTAVLRVDKKMKASEYRAHFFETVRNNPGVVFHNGDLYPPYFKNIRSVSWTKTEKKPTVKTKLMPLAAAYPVERYFIGAFSKNNFGKWRRQYIIDPVLYCFRKIHWRNYEAGYDVFELEPKSRKKSTYVLQEYFVGVDRFDEFTELMSEIFRRHKVNVINVSVRHAKADSGSMLAWAKEEVFAFVVWYKQKTCETEKNKVGVWTRELVNAVLSMGGSYYLPYQPHPASEQFHQAYPRAKELFAMKEKLDPDFRFRNILWDKYYKSE